MGRKETDNNTEIFSLEKSLTIQELGIEIVFGEEEPLRTSGLLTGLDLQKTAIRMKFRQGELEYILANQLAIAAFDPKSSREPRLTRRHQKKAKGILYGVEELPFFVGYTTKAIMDFGLSEDIDSRLFIENYGKYVPGKEELEKHYISDDEITETLRGQAILIGSAVPIYWDGMGENSTFLRQRRGGFYDGFFEIPGGSADSPGDIAGLAELKEETGLADEVISWAKPLGIYDQALIKNGRLTRYLNVVWGVSIAHDTWPGDGDGGGLWRETWDSEAFMLANENRLTPIAEYALRTAKFI